MFTFWVFPYIIKIPSCIPGSSFRGAELMDDVWGAYTPPSLRVQTAPFGRCQILWLVSWVTSVVLPIERSRVLIDKKSHVFTEMKFLDRNPLLKKKRLWFWYTFKKKLMRKEKLIEQKQHLQSMIGCFNPLVVHGIEQSHHH